MMRSTPMMRSKPGAPPLISAALSKQQTITSSGDIVRIDRRGVILSLRTKRACARGHRSQALTPNINGGFNDDG
jgi:hypothetical protein